MPLHKPVGAGLTRCLFDFCGKCSLLLSRQGYLISLTFKMEGEVILAVEFYSNLLYVHIGAVLLDKLILITLFVLFLSLFSFFLNDHPQFT